MLRRKGTPDDDGRTRTTADTLPGDDKPLGPPIADRGLAELAADRLATFVDTAVPTASLASVSDVTAPTLLAAGFTNETDPVITLTFDEPMKLAVGSIPVPLKNGVVPMGITTALVSGSSVQIRTDGALTGSDYVVMDYDGTGIGDLAGNLYPAHTLAIGGSLANTLDFSEQWLPHPLLILAGGGNDRLIGSEGDDTLAGGSGADTLDGGYGIDVIDLGEPVRATDTVRVMAEGEYSGSTVAHPDEVLHFDVSGTTGNDRLALATREISGNQSHRDGLDVGSLARHSITGGILTFENGAGAAVTVNEANLDDALRYLFWNLPEAGRATAFEVDTDGDGSNDSLYVYQPLSWQDPSEFAYSSLTRLAGVSGVTLAASAGLNRVQLVDATAPWAVTATTVSNGLRITFVESIQSHDLTGLSLQAGSGGALGAIKPVTSAVASGSVVTVTAAINVAANGYVIVRVADPSHQQVTDPSGNTGDLLDEDLSGIAIGGSADTVVDLSALAGGWGIVDESGGNDRLIGNGTESWISAGAGRDTLLGGAGADELVGGPGADSLVGGLGADELIGGAGNDTYVVDHVRDEIYETWSDADPTDAGGIDLVKSSVTRTLGDFQENLSLTGTGDINATGNALSNTIAGNAGDNVLRGGAGVDTLSYASATAGVRVTLASTAQQNTVGAGLDTVTGFERLIGSRYGDTLTGNAGSNLVAGGAGNDALEGGAGADVFRFDSALGATTNVDTIRDFVAVDDRIQLENAIFASLAAPGALSAASFRASASGTAVDGNDYVCYETDTGRLFYDADGSGTAVARVHFATLGIASHPVITAADFVVT